MPFLMTSNDAAWQAQATEERPDRWRILSRPGQGASHSEERPRRLYDPDVDGDGREVRESNNFDPATLGRRPSRQEVARILGYGPSSDVLSSGGVSIPPPPGALRQPAEGTALELTANDIGEFTGVLKVRKGSDGGSIIEGEPTEWLTTAVERLRGRRIHVSRWVTALMPRLAPAVRHRFRVQFGRAPVRWPGRCSPSPSHRASLTSLNPSLSRISGRGCSANTFSLRIGMLPAPSLPC